MAQETVLVKTPYKRTVFTDEQLAEFVACADPVTGPAYFMDNYFYIQHPTQGKMLYHPYDYQKRLIDDTNRFRNMSVQRFCELGDAVARGIGRRCRLCRHSNKKDY
jgi:hypothetical protein